MGSKTAGKIGEVPSPKWMDVVDGEMGQEEIAGSKNNPRIVEYFSATTLGPSSDETPWCSAFANWVLKQVGIEGTKSAAALSWLDWGNPIKDPVKGCVVVFNHGQGHGHVTFFDHEKDGMLGCKGGNQNNQVKLSYYGHAELAGYRMPG